MSNPVVMAIHDLDHKLFSDPPWLYASERSRYCSDASPNDFYLSKVIQKGDLARAELYLRHGASPNPKTILWTNRRSWKNDWFPLLWAVESGKLEMVELLLQYGADVNATGGLSEKIWLSSNSYTHDCRRAHTALRCAVEKQNVEMVKKLLSAGACPESYQHHKGSAESRSSRNTTVFCDIPVLCEAVRHANVAIAELLLLKGAKANLPKSYKLGYSYLTEAIRTQTPAMVELLLQYGADPNFEIPRLGTSPLILAAKASKHALEMSKALIDYGAKVNVHEVVHKKVNALTLAITSKNLELVELLLDSGASVDTAESNPLVAAATVDSPTSASAAIVNLLIDRGAHVNCCDPSGLELLFGAVQKQNIAITEVLLKRGATPDVVHNAMTPLKQAVVQGDHDMVRLLLRHGASPTARVFAPVHGALSQETETCCSAVELAAQSSSSLTILSTLQGSESKEPEPMPGGDDEEKPAAVTPVPSRPAVERTISRAVLCISWAICHQPARYLFCEWEMSNPSVRQKSIRESIVIARGRTACSPGPTAKGVERGTFVADWHNDAFKLSCGTPLMETANLKVLVVSQDRQRCMRSCNLHFKVKTDGGLLSKTVGEAWFHLGQLDVGMEPGTTAKFLVQLEGKKQKRIGTLAFELTY